MTTKKATSTTGSGSKKLKLKKQTFRDLDVKMARQIKGGHPSNTKACQGK